jgi:hypothetical protein
MAINRKLRSAGSTTTQLNAGLKYSYAITGTLQTYTGDPGATEITFTGSPNSLRRIEELERNVSIIASKTLTNDGDTINGSARTNKNSWSDTQTFTGSVIVKKTAADSHLDITSSGGTGRNYRLSSLTTGVFSLVDATSAATRLSVATNGDLTPGTTATQKLGTASLKWSELNVSGAVNATTINGALVGNADTATTATNVTATANNVTNETVYLTFVDGATGAQGIETDTDLNYNPSTNTLSVVSTTAKYADLAEKYQSDKSQDSEYPVGTVMQIVNFTGEEAEVTYYRNHKVIAGVVSDKPAYLMNASSDGTALALVGRVPVRVVGQVTKGDLLYALKDIGEGAAGSAEWFGENSETLGAWVGVALENKTTEELGLVECQIKG